MAKTRKKDFDPKDGIIDASEHTAFDAPDPRFWVTNGYALLVVDTTGMNKSEGQFTLLGDQEARDYYDVIEWARTQPWSVGAVATAGVSYLAMNQWRVAELNPAHLKAIMPWHGFSNVYRDLLYPGGMKDTEFFPYWWKILGKNASSPLEDMPGYVSVNPVYNERYDSIVADLRKITVPAYVAAAWSDRGLHKAFDQIASQQKSLEITGRKKWEQYYTNRVF